MRTQHRVASRAKHNPPSFDVSMLNYAAPTVPESLFVKRGPGAPRLNAATQHTAAWDTTVIVGNQDQPEENAVPILNLVKAAYELLRTGGGEPKHFDRLAGAFNVALVRAESIDPLAEQTMLAGIEAMKRCDGIWQRHGRYGFTGPDLTAVTDAIELYEGILRLSTPFQMEAAVNEAARRMIEQGVAS
jgi:hypothetical protein